MGPWQPPGRDITTHVATLSRPGSQSLCCYAASEMITFVRLYFLSVSTWFCRMRRRRAGRVMRSGHARRKDTQTHEAFVSRKKQFSPALHSTAAICP